MSLADSEQSSVHPADFYGTISDTEATLPQTSEGRLRGGGEPGLPRWKRLKVLLLQSIMAVAVVGALLTTTYHYTHLEQYGRLEQAATSLRKGFAEQPYPFRSAASGSVHSQAEYLALSLDQKGRVQSSSPSPSPSHPVHTHFVRLSKSEKWRAPHGYDKGWRKNGWSDSSEVETIRRHESGDIDLRRSINPLLLHRGATGSLASLHRRPTISASAVSLYQGDLKASHGAP